jgi:ABC-type transporter Mla subunit MlaD
VLQQLLLLLLLAMVLLSTRMVLMCVYSLLWFLFWSVSFSSRRGGKNTYGRRTPGRRGEKGRGTILA